ncbi:thiol-disulfide oxidoreductase DCC family protein [Corynebacterium heidelbergense]|uniref:DUF393 domain-containing protein n=1 Tax=Corynebacterium heidelbergense TaxID=2055947 RepID=A0A364VA46_9CORY|nr:DCC1-like thiol-disulfide oxidoreductase family protein [Corynebacterium heidelbergense]RAV33515.1 hypothetical protein CWC39_08030 [Corynebacterium heidelbergense]WCZ36117.1 hypothetical protein CHEID_02780 [Corynebacterium heidelbergense]
MPRSAVAPSCAVFPASPDNRPYPSGAPTFFYDANCGFCQRSANILRALTSTVDICPARPDWDLPTQVTSQISDYAVYLPSGLRAGAKSDGPREEFVGGTPRVNPPVLLGHEAIGAVLAEQGQTLRARLVGRLITFPPLRSVFAAGYRFVADNRYRLGFALRMFPQEPAE